MDNSNSAKQDGCYNNANSPDIGTASLQENRLIPLKFRIRTDHSDVVGAIINFVLTFLFIKTVLFSEIGATWYVTAIYLSFFVLATFLIVSKQSGKINAQAIISGSLCVVSSLSFALRDNPDEINSLMIIMLIYLSGSYCVALTGSNRHNRGSYFFLLDILKTEFLIPLKHFFLPNSAIRQTNKEKKNNDKVERKRKNKRFTAAVIGIICAVPVLLIVVPLLIKSDAAFESVAGSFFSKIQSFFKKGGGILDAVLDNFFYIIPTFVVAPYIFSVMFSFKYSISNEENKDTSEKYTKLRFGSPALFSGFLGIICLVYVIYILSQTAYFFSAFTGKLPDGTNINVVQYARRGFFELTGVAAVNLFLIALTVIFSKRTDGKFSKSIKLFDLFLCTFNILLSAISMSKIILYMNEMGLTHKRIYVFLIDVVMIVTFLCVAIRLFNEKFRYMQVITATTVILFIVLSFSGIDGIIAKYNTEKFLNGKIHCENINELTDGRNLGSFESVLKIAESETNLKTNAEIAVTDYIGYSQSDKDLNDLWQTLYYSEQKNGVCSTSCKSIFSIDHRKALKLSEASIGTIKEAVEKYSSLWGGETDDDVEVNPSIYVSFNSDVKIESIGLTLTNLKSNKSETSVFGNADGSPIEKGTETYVHFMSNVISEGESYKLDISIKDFEGNDFVGSFTADSFVDSESYGILSTGGRIFAVSENSIVELK